MAADALTRAGARVTIYDHRPSPARKLLMAGRGGLNLTHSEPLELFLNRYGAAAPHLEPFLRAFPPRRLREFCAELGEPTFVGTSGRVFPKSFKAAPLLRALLARLVAQGAHFEMRCEFAGLTGERGLLMRRADGALFEIAPEAVVLALGGASWPRLGSDGAWVAPLEAGGVAITPLRPANCGALLDWSPFFRSAFEGQPLKTVRARHGELLARGDLVVTRSGLEGGPIYALSSRLGAAVEQAGATTLWLDLRPDAQVADLTRKLERRQPKQSLATALRKGLRLGKLEIALLHESQPAGLPRETATLAELVKTLPLTVLGVADFARAISTSGGVRFDELDSRLMLKARPGLFLAGEMLDFDAPTGGYLLQAAFSTGYAAGLGAARFVGLEQPSGINDASE